MNASSGLPQWVDPYKLAKTDGVVQGKCELARLPRIRDLLFSDQNAKNDCVTVIMRFTRNQQRRVIISGEISATLVLQCQRCLQGTSWSVVSPLALVVVGDDEAAAQVPREYDPLIVGDEGLSPHELVEDELILAMPVVARCETSDCSQIAQARTAGKQTSPFAKLRDLDFDA